MWNKREEESARPVVAPQPLPVSAPSASSSATAREPFAAIGKSITIVGDVSGDEDLTILGKLKGKIDLPRHNVTVGESGRVEADVHAKVVSVAGEVRGNLTAGEQILIRRTATMLGNLTAPRVGLEDGCCFRGSVEMEAPDKGRSATGQPSRTAGSTPLKPVDSPAASAASGSGAKADAPAGRP